MDYDALLARARTKMPESVLVKERFELPKAVGRLEGAKTIITNLPQIAALLRRPIEHMVKYLLKELATPGQMRNGLFVLGAKMPASRINDKIKQYAEEFVFCQKCGKPDTDIKKESGFQMLVCSVCGERKPVKSKI